MAEARQAVGLTFAITHDGSLKFDYDREVLNLIKQSAQRAYKKSLARLFNNLRTGIFPFGPELLAGSVTLITALNLCGFDVTYGITNAIINTFNINGISWVLVCLISAVASTLLAIAFVRFFLRKLFSYQGWIYLDRNELKNPPILIKLWTGIIKLLTSLRIIGSESTVGKPMLYSFQGALPSLPLPSVKDTLERHLDSVRPIMNDKDFEEMVKLSKEFENGIATKLQRYLWLKWLWSDNYVSDWWEEYVYLRGRSPIVVNSNFYAVDFVLEPATRNQAARTANIIHLAFCFRRILQKQETPPLLIHNLIPLCSRQYDRLFNTTRIPGVETDTLLHLNDSTHIIVIHKGRYFRLGCYVQNRLMEPHELQAQIQGIIEDDSQPDPGEVDLGAMTASERTKWAHVRAKHFSKGSNWSSLDMIDKAAFVVILDDEFDEHAYSSEETLNKYGKLLIHGRGNDRWFDKSFCLVVTKSANIGANVEHSWADAPIFGHLMEYILALDLKLGYDSNGNCKPITDSSSTNIAIPKATKLRWDFSPEVQSVFSSCLKETETLMNDLDLFILRFQTFGKGAIKTCGLSPDAFVQMALQLAYRRDAGHFCLTYEASMTRLYKEGRTETVRSCTVEAATWALAMDNSSVQKSEKVDLLKKACLKHQRMYQDAMTGKGVDRHLFCLYVVSRYLEIDSPFLKKVLSEPWRLSTSQTANRGEYMDTRKHPKMITGGGGFGPVTDDGYGCAYSVIGEDEMFFHVSSKHSSNKTDSKRFARRIEQALQDIRELFT